MFRFQGDDKKIDREITFILIGDYGTGKTSLIDRLVDNSFYLETQSTIGVDFRVRYITIQNTNIKIRIWDTAGMEKFRSLLPSYFRNVDVILIVGDCTVPESIDHMHLVWDKCIKHSSGWNKDKMFLYNVINKWDQQNQVHWFDDKTLEQSIKNRLYNLNEHKTFFVSAKSGEGVLEMIEIITKEIIKKQTIEVPPMNSLLIEETRNEAMCGCCS